MPWFFPWSDSIKKRAVRYLLQHYMGHLLKEKLSLDQLSVDLYNGKGTVKEILLDVAYLNDSLDAAGVPLEIIDGFIGSISVTVPWSSLITDNTVIEINDLEVTVAPKQRADNGGVPLDSMLFSMTMTSSMQLAEECLRQEPAESELRAADAAQPFEGLELFAKTIEAVLSKVKLSFQNTIVRLEHVPPDSDTGMGLEVRIERIDYFDDLALGQESDLPQNNLTSDMAIKNVHMCGIKVYCDEFRAELRTVSRVLLFGEKSSLSQLDTSGSVSPTDSCLLPVTSQPFSTIDSQKTLPGVGTEQSNKTSAAKELDLILIADFIGRQELKIRIKQNEGLPGAKLEMDCSVGCINIYLSPHNLHMLLELAKGLSSPGVGENSVGKRSVNKPINQVMFEQEIQRELRQQCRRDNEKFRTASESSEGMVAQPLDDSDDEVYLSLANNCSTSDSMESSAYSQSSTATGSSVTFSKKTTALSATPAAAQKGPAATSRQKQQTHGRESKQTSHQRHQTVDDASTNSDVSKFKVKVAFLSLIILHEEPSAGVPQDDGTAVTSVTNRLRDNAEQYFNNIRRNVSAVTGVMTAAGMAQLRNTYCKACPVDHIGLLCKPITIEMSRVTGRIVQTATVDVSVGLLDLAEAVFDRRPSTASFCGFHLPIENVLPEFTELLVFSDDAATISKPLGQSAMYTSLRSTPPCLRVHMKSVDNVSSAIQTSPLKTDVEIELTACKSELDITIVDRIHALLNKKQPMNSRGANAPYWSHYSSAQSQSRQTLFTQAMDDDSLRADRKLNVQLSSSNFTLVIRFPKVDLRTGFEKPWWKRNVHAEQLSLEMDNSKLNTTFDGSTTVVTVEFTCQQCRGGFIRKHGEDPFEFIHISADTNLATEQAAGFDWPRLVIKSFPLKQSVFDDAMEESAIPFDSLNGACDFKRLGPSPFSSRKVMYENQELIMPGDKQDIAEFHHKAINNTQLHIDINFPNLYIYLPDKDFLEVIYNRLLNDMILWEPVAPVPIDTQDPHSFLSGTGALGWSPDMVPQLMQHGLFPETFSAFKSASHFDSSSDSDDDSEFHSMTPETKRRQKQRNQQENIHQQSRMCLSLSVGKGRLFGRTSAAQNTGIGQFMLDISDSSLFVVVGYNGDPELQFLCVQLHKAQLDHLGLIESGVSSVNSLDALISNADHFQPTIYMSDSGLCSRLSEKVGRGPDTEDMVTVAVRICNESYSNVKKYQMALGVRCATLRHRPADAELSWYEQILNFFSLVDYEIPGYSVPKVVVELHTHLWSCAVDYRPLHLNYRALITMETFSISSNIIIDSAVSLLRFLVDEGSVYLSDNIKAKEVDIKRNYVCVLDVGTFEISLRTSNGSDPRHAKMDICLSNNVLHLRTCSDSCYAITELINYLSKDGDLTMDRPTLVTADNTATQTPSSGNCSLSDSPKLTRRHIAHVHDMVADAMKETSSDQAEYSDCDDDIHDTSSNAAKAVSVSSLNMDSSVGLDRPVKSTSQQSMNTSQSSGTSCYSDGPHTSSYQTAAMAASTNSASEVDELSDCEEFCIIDEPGLGITSKSGEPCVRVLTNEPIKIVDDHFRMPVGKTDILKAPEHFPMPVYRYTISDLTIVWLMYGGKDFRSSTPTSVAVKCREVNSAKSAQQKKYDSHNTGAINWRVTGGPGRDMNTLMEIHLNKIRLQHEIYPGHTMQASRQVLVIGDIEIRDRLTLSKINKFLYQYSSDAIPRQSHASMLVVKALHVRPDQSLTAQECMLKVSLQPLRLNIDQDALFFFRAFFNDISGRFTSASDSKSTPAESSLPSGDPASLAASPKHAAAVGGDRQPVMTVGGDMATMHTLPNQITDPEEMLLIFSEIAEAASARGENADCDSVSQGSNHSSQSGSAQAPVFFKSFTFSPDVPIRLDYHGKWVDMEQGTVAGLVVGLAQLNCSELRLKRLHHRQGLRGVDRLVAYALHEWLSDIKKNQQLSLLGGVGPMYALVQLVQGCWDLFRLPVEQYRRDGRIVRGIQRGAHSFMTCTAMSTLELTNRLVQTIQFAAEAAYDVVSPGPSVRQRRRRTRRPRRLAPPSDLREGVSNAVTIVTDGFRSTASNIYHVAVHEHEQKGVTGAVGGVLRQIPSTVLEPVIIATEATSNVLSGMCNQLLPDKRVEDEQKWKPPTDSD